MYDMARCSSAAFTTHPDVGITVGHVVGDGHEQHVQRRDGFNQDISSWDTSSVVNMNNMFNGATSFNQDISSWVTSSVTDMGAMFQSAVAFDQPIPKSGSQWDTTLVTDMSNMFFGAAAFNQDLSTWVTQSVTDMSGMFQSALLFNYGMVTSGSVWDTSSVVNMNNMFNGATSFNQNISSWNTALVVDMGAMFQSAVAFNQPIPKSGSQWDTSLVTDMNNMFKDAVPRRSTRTSAPGSSAPRQTSIPCSLERRASTRTSPDGLAPAVPPQTTCSLERRRGSPTTARPQRAQSMVPRARGASYARRTSAWFRTRARRAPPGACAPRAIMQRESTRRARVPPTITSRAVRVWRALAVCSVSRVTLRPEEIRRVRTRRRSREGRTREHDRVFVLPGRRRRPHRSFVYGRPGLGDRESWDTSSVVNMNKAGCSKRPDEL